jgi:hypothetical protein
MWQFRVDGRPAGPVRKKRAEAEHDAIVLGYASRFRNGVRLYHEVGAELRHIVPSGGNNNV